MDTKISDLAKHVGETVTLRGWLYNKRSSKKVHFLEVRDGYGNRPSDRVRWKRNRRRICARRSRATRDEPQS